MTTLAFKDSADGYYQVDVIDGVTPAWAQGMTPCALATPATPTLAQVQSDTILGLYTSYQSECQQPVSFTSKGGVSKQFEADDGSRICLTKLFPHTHLPDQLLVGFIGYRKIIPKCRLYYLI